MDCCTHSCEAPEAVSNKPAAASIARHATATDTLSLLQTELLNAAQMMHLLDQQGTLKAATAVAALEVWWLGQHVLRCFTALLRAACLL
jgi:hypothetical protein